MISTTLIKRFLVSTCAITSLHGAVIFSETASGDLSGDRTSPTMTMVTVGQNTIIGQVGNNGNTGATNGSDADYFFVPVATGFEITSLTIDSHVSAPGSAGSSFFGYRAGIGFAGQGTGNIDGFQLINSSSGEVLPALAGGNLPAGDYSFWIQETSPNTVDYQVTFNVDAIPEPSSTMLLLLGSLTFAFRRRR